MLDTFNRFDHRCWWSFKVFLFLTICFPSLCTSRDCGQNLYLQGTFYEHFVEYFNSIDENTELEEMVDNLIYLRQSILIQGYECPSIREMCQHAVEYIMGRRVPIDDPIIEELIQRIEEREIELGSYSQDPRIELCKHKHKHKHKGHKSDKEMKMNGKSIYGFIKILAGGLMAIIPVPVIQSAGVGLIIYGINDVMDGSREQGEENDRLRQLDELRREEANILNAVAGP